MPVRPPSPFSFYRTALERVWRDREERESGRSAVDPEIVERARSGDAEALEVLLGVLTPPLLRFASRLCRDPALAEELVTEALYRGAVKLKKLRKPGSIEPWLRRILVNLWRDQWRKRGQRHELVEELPELPAPPQYDPARVAYARELETLLATEVSRLPPGQRAILTLKVDGGLSLAEIAQALGTTADRVKANLWHARRRLKERLGKILEEGTADGGDGVGS